MHSLYLILKQYKIIVKMVIPVILCYFVIVICLGCLEWPSHRDHHLITSSDQLADCYWQLIIATEDIYLTWLQHQVGSPVGEIM